MRQRVAVCSLAVAAGLVLAGCSNPVEGVLEGFTGAGVPTGVEKLVEDITDGQAEVMPSGEIPSDFPQGVPLPDVAPTQSMRFDEGEGVNWMLQYHGGVGAADIATLGGRLVDRGYIEESNVAMGDAMVVALYSNDEYRVNLSLLGGDDEKFLQIIVTQIVEG